LKDFPSLEIPNLHAPIPNFKPFLMVRIDEIWEDPGDPLIMTVTKNQGFYRISYIFGADSYTFRE
jgi:hypothetical protein